MKKQLFFLLVCLGSSSLLYVQEPPKGWLEQLSPYVEPLRQKAMEWWSQAGQGAGYGAEKAKEIARVAGEKAYETTGYTLDDLRELARKAKGYLPEEVSKQLGYTTDR